MTRIARRPRIRERKATGMPIVIVPKANYFSGMAAPRKPSIPSL